MHDTEIIVNIHWLRVICDAYLAKFGVRDTTLEQLFTFATRYAAVIPPAGIYVFCEQGRTDCISTGCEVNTLRLLVTDTNDRQQVAVTRSFYLDDLFVGPIDAEQLARKVERLVAAADRLIGPLRALKVDADRPEPSLASADEHLHEQITQALEGDSNDADHDALVSVAQHLGLKWISYEEREELAETD